MAHILIVDDEAALGTVLAALFRRRDHSAESVTSGAAALEAAANQKPDLALLDLHLGAMDGMELLQRLHQDIPGLPVVIMTAFGNVQAAVDAMKAGAVDFVTKPFDNEQLIRSLEALLSLPRAEHAGERSLIVGESPQFRETEELALKFAVPNISILLYGETGTGKEVFARTIHAASKRRNGPFIAVDCSTLPENLIESELFGHEKGAFTGALATRVGCLELAQGGTLFLDEIGNLPLTFQPKLLRVLQERTMTHVGGREQIDLDVRLISATNVSLKEAMSNGQFRQDLYYRINEMTISLPPLREREGDTQRLAVHFAQFYSKQFGKEVQSVSAEALATLQRHLWPGNVRELRNVIKSAVVMAETVIEPQHLPTDLAEMATRVSTKRDTVHEHEDQLKIALELLLDNSALDLKEVAAMAAEQAERALLDTLVERRHISGAQLARLLNVDPKTLRLKLRKYGIGKGS